MILTATNEQSGLYCLLVGILLIAFGYYVWKKQQPDLIPGYKVKPSRDIAVYCKLVGKGTILCGIGLIILSIPLPLENPNKIMALCCLLCCLALVAWGISLYVRANKS
jgi:hypothetical protein